MHEVPLGYRSVQVLGKAWLASQRWLDEVGGSQMLGMREVVPDWSLHYKREGEKVVAQQQWQLLPMWR